MACESCFIKFSLFKRKKQCMDCLRYFCTECVIRRFDRVLSCDNCSMLSRRPLIRSQLLQMRSKYLRQYLIAKRVNIRGCIEKEDLVNLLIIYANGNDLRRNSERIENTPRDQGSERRVDPTTTGPSDGEVPTRTEPDETESLRPEINELESNEAEFNEVPSSPNPIVSEVLDDVPMRRSRSPQTDSRPNDETGLNEEAGETPERPLYNVEIEEVLEVDEDMQDAPEPEPVITEQEDVPPIPSVNQTETFTEVHRWSGIVKLSDIKELPELEQLSVKQLKDLLRANRVDFKGCVERRELLDRACRLWEEYHKSRQVIESADEDSLCKICLDAPIECVILECGHMACCINCGKQMSECPICRQYVVRVVRFFKA
ncbi:hypothetical protein QAD02_016034 [Eretmocerus hayati]|uniref:Uncharacterized protein n=1 Tax=Eretmocerus hayati TaxID=131215 RepID=A0ACC2PCT6_9HYME|nr:hypothetical protein QAD02_016034 [Eretmocerus hayati]